METRSTCSVEIVQHLARDLASVDASGLDIHIGQNILPMILPVNPLLVQLFHHNPLHFQLPTPNRHGNNATLSSSTSHSDTPSHTSNIASNQPDHPSSTRSPSLLPTSIIPDAPDNHTPVPVSSIPYPPPVCPHNKACSAELTTKTITTEELWRGLGY